MNKKKKIIIIISIIISIVLIIAGVICLVIGNEDSKKEQEVIEQEETGISRLTAIKDKMLENNNYYVNFTLNDNNKKIINKKDDKTKVTVINEGDKNTYIVKEDTTYLLVDKSKKMYEYKNNTALLNDFTNKLKDILTKNYTTGKENINGKEYRYEEFQNTSVFIINYKGSIDDANTKTRVYFDGDTIKYIKTYVGNVEQLLNVEIEYDKQTESEFEIPEEYEK